MSDVVHVAYLQENLASDYNRHTGTAMLSMLEYCSKHAVIHLFHEEIRSQDNIPKRDEEMNKFRKMVSEFDAEIHFHNVTFPEEFERYINLESNCWSKNWRRIIFTRYFLQDLLPDVDRIIVFGSDTIVHTDVATLLESMPEKYSLGAAPTIIASALCSKLSIHEENKIKKEWVKSWGKYVLDAGLDLKQMMMGCVHLFNLKKMRETRILPEKALALYLSYPDKNWIDDQVLSILFRDDIYFLKERFNYYGDRRAKTIDDFNLNDYILHFPDQKPWNTINSFYDIEYWSNFYKTPWGREDRGIVELKNAILTFDKVYTSLDEYVWKKPLLGKIRMLWELTIPLYLKLIKRYLNHFLR